MKTYLLQMLQSFYDVIEDQKYYYLDPINRIIVLALQVWQKVFALGLGSHLS